jgi:hypothetical protein
MQLTQVQEDLVDLVEVVEERNNQNLEIDLPELEIHRQYLHHKAILVVQQLIFLEEEAVVPHNLVSPEIHLEIPHQDKVVQGNSPPLQEYQLIMQVVVEEEE